MQQNQAKPKGYNLLNYLLLIGILLITFFCYKYSLKNQFLSWDDTAYVSQNHYLQNLSFHNLNKVLEDTRSGNFHPLTMLSLAGNWYFGGLNPQGYYATNIILHLVNTALVFLLSLVLFRAMVKKGYHEIKGISYLAGLCALWFGIHPMHVESVSWLSERKDLLYLLFYLLGLIAYVKYVMAGKRKFMVFVAIFYLLSLLSKPMAIVFPITLLTIDILLKRKIEWKLLFEKAPFILIAVVFGYVTYELQNTSGMVGAFNTFTIFQRIMFAGYDYLMYIWKLFFPFKLCSLYPYPAPNNLPFYFYIAPVVSIGITALLIYSAYKKGENCFRVVLFGFGFYLSNILLVLQFISAGPAIMADRYSYAAYIGLFFMAAYFIAIYYRTLVSNFSKYTVLGLLTVFSCMLGYLCHARTKVWHDSETLWTDVNKKCQFDKSYINLGSYYYSQYQKTNSDSDLDKASENFLNAIKIKTEEESVYSYMGIISLKKKEYRLSLSYFNTAIKMNSLNADNYVNRSVAYISLAKYDSAVSDLKHALSLGSNSEITLDHLAWAYLNAQKFDSAIKYYDRLIEMNPYNSSYYRYRGAAKFDKGELKLAMDDFMKNLRISPRDSQCMFFLSKAYERINSFDSAYKYAQWSQNEQYPVPNDYILSLKAKLK